MANISVIIPNYNHGPFLEERIESVIGQRFPPMEIIILDDHSSDQSREIIENYRSHPLVTHIVYNEENSGSPFKQWAKGIQMAKADWIWIAESDDIADPGFLETAQLAIVEYPGTGIFYSDSSCKAEAGESLRFNKFSEAKNKFFHSDKWNHDYSREGKVEINESLKWICSINNSSAAVIKKELVKEICDNLETFIFHGDWYCQLALALHTRVTYRADALNTFRIHPGNFLGRTDQAQSKLECFRILDFLYQKDFVTEKDQLVEFFTLQWLGYGFFSDGFRFGKNLFRAYAAINRPLSRRVFRALVRQKLSAKRRKQIF